MAHKPVAIEKVATQKMVTFLRPILSETGPDIKPPTISATSARLPISPICPGVSDHAPYSRSEGTTAP